MASKTESIEARSILWHVFRFPLTRIILAALFVMAGVAAAQMLIGLSGSSASTPVNSILAIIIALLAVYFAYRFYVQLIEKRQVNELSPDGAIKEVSAGLLTGLGIVTLVIGLLWLTGSYQVDGINPWLVLLPAAVANVPSGFVQEILFRGILFKIAEESLGTWIALAISALLFGLIHILSTGATLFSTLSVALEAGILLGAAYILTHRLWLAIGIHIAWDFAVDGIFGAGSSALSGKPMQGLLQARLTGMDLLTGGAHGVEASVVAILVAMIIGCFLTWLAWREKKFVDPDWILNRNNK